MLQLRKLSPRNPLSRWENGQGRQLSVCLCGEKFLRKFAQLPFCQHLLKHRSVSKEIIMFVDRMTITKSSVISASVCAWSDSWLHLYAKLIICSKRNSRISPPKTCSCWLRPAGVWQVVQGFNAGEKCSFNNICVIIFGQTYTGYSGRFLFALLTCLDSLPGGPQDVCQTSHHECKVCQKTSWATFSNDTHTRCCWSTWSRIRATAAIKHSADCRSVCPLIRSLIHFTC